MYKCRRIISGLVVLGLSLACISSITFFAYADESGQLSVLFRYISQDGTVSSQYQRTIQEGWLYTSGLYGIQIDGFQYRPRKPEDSENIYFAFRLSAYSSDNSAFSLDVSNSSITHTVTAGFFDNCYVRSIPSGRGSDLPASLTGTDWRPASKTSSWFIRATAKRNENPSNSAAYNITLNTPYQIKPTNNGAIWFYLDNIYFSISSAIELNYYLEALPILSNILTYFEDIYNNLLTSIYQWQQITYNPVTDEFEVNDSNGNYFEALLGAIQSLNADALSQAVQQNKAKEAGAEDALDNAYDSVGSSFGSLGDLSGLGSLGSFDGDVLGNAGSGGLLSWFSQDTLDSIDSVPRTRKPDNIIDFYSGKIQSYMEEVSSDDDSTAD